MSKRNADDDDDDDGDNDLHASRRVITEPMEGVTSVRKHCLDDADTNARKRMTEPRSTERDMFSLNDLRSMLAAQLLARESALRLAYTGHYDALCADMYEHFIHHQRDSVDTSTWNGMNSYLS